MQEKKPYWHDALFAFARMSAWVVFPIIGALLVGKWLDAKYHTEPYFFLGLTAFAFVVSITGLVLEAKKYLKNIKSNGPDTPADNTRD